MHTERVRVARGVTLLEALISTLVLLAGLVGVLQGVLFASRQNHSALAISEAASIASQVRAGMTWQGRTRLVSSSPVGLLDAARCDPSLAPLAGTLETLAPAPCFVDLDAFDAAPPDTGWEIIPGYSDRSEAIYRRVLVWQTGNPTLESVSVVVSWLEGGVRQFHQQYLSLYNAQANGAGMDHNL